MMVRQRSRRSHYAVQHKIGDNPDENRGSAECSRQSGCRHFMLAKEYRGVSSANTAIFRAQPIHLSA